MHSACCPTQVLETLFASQGKSWGNVVSSFKDCVKLSCFLNFQQSPVKINQVSLDESGEHMGVCSEDGKVRWKKPILVFLLGMETGLTCYILAWQQICRQWSPITIIAPWFVWDPDPLAEKLIIKAKYIWLKCALGKVITRHVNNVTGIKLINSCDRGGGCASP